MHEIENCVVWLADNNIESANLILVQHVVRQGYRKEEEDVLLWNIVHELEHNMC